MAPTADLANNNPPPGSAYLDEMLRYLPSIGTRQFHLPQEENKRYVLETVYKTVTTYGTDGFPKDTFWDRVLLGGPHTHICLLPFTESARQYHLSHQDAVMLKIRKGVKPTMRKIYINLVLEDKRRKKPFATHEVLVDQSTIERVHEQAQAPCRRRKRPMRLTEGDSTDGEINNNGQSLDAMADSIAKQCDEAMKAQIRVVRTMTYTLMKNDLHVSVMKAIWVDELSNKEAATRFSMTESNVRAICRKFTELFLKTWNELENPQD